MSEKKEIQLLGKINAARTLVANFPMSILDMYAGRKWNSIFDYILEIAAALSVSPKVIVQYLIKELYNVIIPIRDGVFEQVGNADYNGETSAFICKLEDAVKTIIMNILTGIFSCSAIPKIPKYDLDVNQNSGESNWGLSIPVELIDYFCMLDVYPLSDMGRNFYSIDSNDNIRGANQLYKSKDMNAFLWYVTHRGYNHTQVERNKMVWDSRRPADEKHGVTRNDEQWEEWLNSKEEPDGFLEMSGDDNDTIHPILQLGNGDTSTLYVSFPQQTFVDEEGKRKNLYQFNKEYLDSIRIFNPKVILTYMLETLFGFRLNADIQWGNDLLSKKIEAIVRHEIDNMDDMEVNDCYYTFSNEEYDDMLNETIRRKYQAKQYGTDKNPYAKIDVNGIISQLDAINDSATPSSDRTKMIEKLVDNVTVTPSSEKYGTATQLVIDWNGSWWKEMLVAFIMPIVKSVLTPQVMLLFIINFKELGLINLKDIKNTDDVLSFLIQKMLGIIVSLTRYVKDMFINMILDFVKEKLLPLIIQVKILRIKEIMEAWLLLLAEAMNAFLTLRNTFGAKKIIQGIDDVDYADITPVESVPQSGNSCQS